jgi:hypothetical protein
MDEHHALSASGAAPNTPDFWAEARAILGQAIQKCGEPQDLAEFGVLARAEHHAQSEFIHFLETLVGRLITIAAVALAPLLKPVKARADCLPQSKAGGGGSRALARETEGGEERSRSDETQRVSRDERREPQGERLGKASGVPTTPTTRRLADLSAPPEEWRVSFSVLRQQRQPLHGANRPVSRRQQHNRDWRERCARLEAAGVRKPYKPPYQPRRFVSVFALAMRLEALRRVIADPAPYIHRLARRLNRIRAYNKIANRPRVLGDRLRNPAKRSIGWLCCGGPITALTLPMRDALTFVDSG